MRCTDVRIALSALADGEDPGQPAAAVAAHLGGCPACERWRADAEQVTRAVRVQAVRVPDLTERVLAAVRADPAVAAASGSAGPVLPADPERSRRRILQLAVAVAALVQLALAVPILVTGGAAGGPHASREMASFDIALAVGFLLAAWRPARARVFVPVAAVLAGCLAVTSVVDLATATTGVGTEVGHLVALVQAGLLWALGRTVRHPQGSPEPAPATG